jgi:hypothetical protein
MPLEALTVTAMTAMGSPVPTVRIRRVAMAAGGDLIADGDAVVAAGVAPRGTSRETSSATVIAHTRESGDDRPRSTATGDGPGRGRHPQRCVLVELLGGDAGSRTTAFETGRTRRLGPDGARAARCSPARVMPAHRRTGPAWGDYCIQTRPTVKGGPAKRCCAVLRTDLGLSLVPFIVFACSCVPCRPAPHTTTAKRARKSSSVDLRTSSPPCHLR